MTKTLKQRAVWSGGWVIFRYLMSQVLHLGTNLILTQLLVQEVLGVMAMVAVIMSSLDVGLLQNIVGLNS